MVIQTILYLATVVILLIVSLRVNRRNPQSTIPPVIWALVLVLLIDHIILPIGRAVLEAKKVPESKRTYSIDEGGEPNNFYCNVALDPNTKFPTIERLEPKTYNLSEFK